MSMLLLGHGSYFAIILLLILTGLGLPVPEEVAIIAAGVMASHQQMNPSLAWMSCMIGVLVGDLVVYGIGRHFGRSFVREHPWWARFVDAKREAQIERMIQHGLKVFFLARFLVGLRSPVYLAAGVLRMPLRRFLLIDLFCAQRRRWHFFLLSFYFGQTIVLWIRRKSSSRCSWSPDSRAGRRGLASLPRASSFGSALPETSPPSLEGLKTRRASTRRNTWCRIV